MMAYWLYGLVLLKIEKKLRCISRDGRCLQLPEFGVQAAITLILGFGGKWFCFLVQLPMLIYNVRTYMRKDHLVHATDVFQNVKTEQKLRFGKLIYTILFFVLVIYR